MREDGEGRVRGPNLGGIIAVKTSGSGVGGDCNAISSGGGGGDGVWVWGWGDEGPARKRKDRCTTPQSKRSRGIAQGRVLVIKRKALPIAANQKTLLQGCLSPL